jgi:hypothetical protein
LLRLVIALLVPLHLAAVGVVLAELLDAGVALRSRVLARIAWRLAGIAATAAADAAADLVRLADALRVPRGGATEVIELTDLVCARIAAGHQRLAGLAEIVGARAAATTATATATATTTTTTAAAAATAAATTAGPWRNAQIFDNSPE